MSTKFAAALVALTFTTGIGFPAAADDASPYQFLTVSGIKAVALTPQELASTRGAYSYGMHALKPGNVIKITVNADATSTSESGFIGLTILSTNMARPPW